jgi:Holliday junction resolvase RusA-like endonuclease
MDGEDTLFKVIRIYIMAKTTKLEREYLEEFGDVPEDTLDRMDYLLNKVNLKHAKSSVYEELKRILNIKWNKISYTIYLLPKATPRPRLGSKGVFYVKGAADNKKVFEKYLVGQDIPLITTPVKFYCDSYFPIPKSMGVVEKVCAELGFIHPTSKPDWDNVAKAYCDMIQGSLLYDDSLVIEGYSKKHYSVKPRIEVTIYYMDDYDCQYNKKKILRKVGPE